MQDPRIRIAAGVILPVMAFISLQGAALALLWWLAFTPGISLMRKNRLVLPLVVMTAFFSLMLELFGGSGLSYFARMTVIILLGIWLYDDQRPGEFLDTSVWLFGDRAGFELGLVAEMGMQSLWSIIADLDRVRLASNLKGVQWGTGSLVPAGLILVHGALSRAEESAELLAMRGYRSGGTWCPVFETGRWDRAAGLAAIFVALFTLLPVSEFFILYR